MSKIAKQETKRGKAWKVITIVAIIGFVILFMAYATRPWIFGATTYTPEQWNIILESDDITDGTYYVYGNVTYNGPIMTNGSEVHLKNELVLNDTLRIEYTYTPLQTTQSGKIWSNIEEGKLIYVKAVVKDEEVRYVDYVE